VHVHVCSLNIIYIYIYLVNKWNSYVPDMHQRWRGSNACTSNSKLTVEREMLFLDLKLINKHSFSLLFQTLFKSCFIMSRRYIFILLGFQCELHNSLVMQWSWYQALNPSNEVVPVRLLYRAISLHKLSRLPRMKILACFRISPLFIFLSGIWRCSIINCKINSHLISLSHMRINST
jgi:hypothetical protein